MVTGVAMSVAYLRRTAWAPVMLAVVVSSYVFRIGAKLRYEETGHTLFFHYTVHTILAACAAATVLGAREWLRDHPVSLGSRARMLRAVVPVVAGIVCVLVAVSWAADLGVRRSLAAQQAHGERLPNGDRTRYAGYVPSHPFFPSDAVRAEVEEEYGRGALPVVLADSERPFAFYPWHAYVQRDRTSSSSLTLWDQRYTEIQRLAGIADPAEFARATAHTRFGRIDVFVLRGARERWLDVSFAPEQFDSPTFRRVVVGAFTVYLRRGAAVEVHDYPR